MERGAWIAASGDKGNMGFKKPCLFEYMCIYIYICMYIYTCIYVYTQMYVMYTYIYIYVYLHMYIYIYIYTHSNMCIYIYIYMYTQFFNLPSNVEGLISTYHESVVCSEKGNRTAFVGSAGTGAEKFQGS